MRLFSPQSYTKNNDYLGVGAMDMAFNKGVGDPWFRTPGAYFVARDLRPLEGQYAYTNQGQSAVSVDPMSQGFAGELALQTLADLQAASNRGG